MDAEFIINEPFTEGIKIAIWLFLDCFGIFCSVYQASANLVEDKIRLDWI